MHAVPRMHEDVAHQRFYHNSARLKLGTMYVYKATLGAANASKMDRTFSDSLNTNVQ